MIRKGTRELQYKCPQKIYILGKLSNYTPFHLFARNVCSFSVMCCHFKHTEPETKSPQFSDGIFKCISLIGHVYISTKIWLTFVPKGSINNITAPVQIMAWRRSGHFVWNFAQIMQTEKNRVKMNAEKSSQAIDRPSVVHH